MNNFRRVVFVSPLWALLAALAVSGCEKANDLPRLKDEALATAKTYQEQVDDLAHRAQVVGHRLSTLPAQALNSATAQRAYQGASSVLARTRNDLQQVAVRAQTGATSGKREDLERLIAELHQRTDDAIREAGSGIAAVESWVAIAEQRQRASAGAGGAAGATVPAGSEDAANMGSDAAVR